MNGELHIAIPRCVTLHTSIPNVLLKSLYSGIINPTLIEKPERLISLRHLLYELMRLSTEPQSAAHNFFFSTLWPLLQLT